MRPQYLFSLALTAVVSLSAIAQQTPKTEDVHATLIPGKKRSMIAYTGRDIAFTMEAPARSAKPSDLPGFITIDGQIIQSTLVPAQPSPEHHSPGPSLLTPAREQEILTNYMNYELGYYKKKLKQKYTNLQTEWVTIKDRLFLVWYFDMPEDYKLVSRQLYFSTLFSGQVLDINAPVFKNDQFGKARNLLDKLAHTLKTFDKPIDLVAMQKQISK